MIKSFVKIVGAGLVLPVLILGNAFGYSVTTVVQPNTMTNLLATYPSGNPAKVTQIIVSATTNANASALIYDTPTNKTVYAVPAYTNTISYFTNLPVIYTNYFGNLATNADITGTNWVLVDNTNNVVAATTNSYPIRAGVSVLAGTQAVVSGNYLFLYDPWATNNSGGTLTVTLIFNQ